MGSRRGKAAEEGNHGEHGNTEGRRAIADFTGGADGNGVSLARRCVSNAPFLLPHTYQKPCVKTIRTALFPSVSQWLHRWNRHARGHGRLHRDDLLTRPGPVQDVSWSLRAIRAIRGRPSIRLRANSRVSRACSRQHGDPPSPFGLRRASDDRGYSVEPSSARSCWKAASLRRRSNSGRDIHERALRGSTRAEARRRASMAPPLFGVCDRASARRK